MHNYFLYYIHLAYMFRPSWSYDQLGRNYKRYQMCLRCIMKDEYEMIFEGRERCHLPATLCSPQTKRALCLTVAVIFDNAFSGIYSSLHYAPFSHQNRHSTTTGMNVVSET